MADGDLDRLRGRLLDAGIAPRFVARAVAELRDHVDDIKHEAAENGLSYEAADGHAIERVGAMEAIAEHYLHRPEMRCWFYRYPRLARVVLPVAYAFLLPTLPIHAGIRHAPSMGKWCASLLLGGLVTLAMLLIMQITIMLA
jgi:hypothetical protein